MKNVEIIENTYIPQKSRKKEVILKKENFSLYVGDLSVKVEEKDILNIFSKMSGLLSVRICRDVISKKSLGYGYINFKDTKYAKRAMKKMNFYFPNRSHFELWTCRMILNLSVVKVSKSQKQFFLFFV